MKKITQLLVLLGCLGFGVSAHAVVVASFNPLNPGSIVGFSTSGVYVPAQTFTSSATGELSDISVLLSENGGVPTSIEIGLYDMSSGLPNSLLGTASILSPALSSSLSEYTADFTPLNITIQDGQEYALAFFASGSGGASIGGAFNQYLDGIFVVSTDGTASWDIGTEGVDLAFSVSASPIPLPSAVWLFGTGFLALFGITKRKRLAS